MSSTTPAEKYNVAAAIEYAEFADLPSIWLLGWSFGTDLALMHGLDPAIVGAILLSPPLRYSERSDLERWAESGKRVVAFVPEHDDYLQPEKARERFEPLTREIVPMAGSKHLWVGDAEKVLDEVVRLVAPDVETPLPREWDGPLETADTSTYNAHNLAAYKDKPGAGSPRAGTSRPAGASRRPPGCGRSARASAATRTANAATLNRP